MQVWGVKTEGTQLLEQQGTAGCRVGCDGSDGLVCSSGLKFEFGCFGMNLSNFILAWRPQLMSDCTFSLYKEDNDGGSVEVECFKSWWAVNSFHL